MMDAEQYEERLWKNKKEKRKTVYLINVHYIGEIAYVMIAFDLMMVVLLQLLQTWSTPIAWIVFSMYIVEIIKYCFLIHVVVCILIVCMEKRYNTTHMQKKKIIYRIRGDHCFGIIFTALLIALGMFQLQENLKNAFYAPLATSSLINVLYYITFVIEIIMFLCIATCILLWVQCPGIPLKPEKKETNMERYLAIKQEERKEERYGEIDTQNAVDALNFMKSCYEVYRKEEKEDET